MDWVASRCLRLRVWICGVDFVAIDLGSFYVSSSFSIDLECGALLLAKVVVHRLRVQFWGSQRCFTCVEELNKAIDWISNNRDLELV